jgi:large subunit ribosomal protein L19
MKMMETVTISPVNMEERRRIDIRSGDTVRVWQKIEEKGKTRLQAFEGVVLARKHGSEAGASFTVRRVAGGYGVEKIFPLYSPNIDKIEIVRRAKVRRAKLYHIREKAAREIKRQMRNMRFVDIATTSDMEEKAAAEAAEEVASDETPPEVQETPVAEERQTPEVQEEKTS